MKSYAGPVMTEAEEASETLLLRLPEGDAAAALGDLEGDAAALGDGAFDDAVAAVGDGDLSDLALE